MCISLSPARSLALYLSLVFGLTGSSNHRPQIVKPYLQTIDHKPQTKIMNHKASTPRPKTQIPQTSKPKTQNPKPKTKTPKAQTPNPDAAGAGRDHD